MPAESRRTVITATAPTPNGPLHIGHLSGPYLAADVAARAARGRGENILTVCGFDPHQNYTLAKAQLQQRPVHEVLDQCEELVRAALTAARIDHDVFIQPRREPDYRDAVARLVTDLLATKAAEIAPAGLYGCDSCGRTLHHAYVSGLCPVCGTGSGGGTCEGCGAFTTAATLLDVRCGCGGSPVALEVEVPLLRLEQYRDTLQRIWSVAVLPPRVRALIEHYLTHGLPDVPLAYPTDWGIPLHPDGPRVDVWVEMGLGYLYRLSREIDPTVGDAASCAAAFTAGIDGCWHFLGIDNAFYYAVLFPALFAAAGVSDPPLRGLVVNEFYRLTGAKFSTSRDHAIWAHELLAKSDPALVRLYLCWDRPDTAETDFTPANFAAFGDRIGARRAAAGQPGPLDTLDVARAERALGLRQFDPALAIRILLGLPELGASQAPQVLDALEGRSPRRSGT